jgi:hypothetical protein
VGGLTGREEAVKVVEKHLGRFFLGIGGDDPPEFTRAEQFDGVFFVDLPSREQKDAIWSISTRHYGRDPRQPKLDDAQWIGAEIKSCCRLAALLGHLPT